MNLSVASLGIGNELFGQEGLGQSTSGDNGAFNAGEQCR